MTDNLQPDINMEPNLRADHLDSYVEIKAPESEGPQLLLDLFETQKIDGFLPRSAISMRAILPIIGRVYLFQYMADQNEYLIRLWGSQAVEVLGIDLQGKMLNEISGEAYKKYRMIIEKAHRQRQPLTVRNREIEYHKEFLTAEICFVPISFDGKTCDGVAGAFEIL